MTHCQVQERSSETPEESQTKASPTSKASQRSTTLSEARKLASSDFACDWCGRVKSDIRRTGARICHDCWLAYLDKKP
jgi:hypothetical protein